MGILKFNIFYLTFKARICHHWLLSAGSNWISRLSALFNFMLFSICVIAFFSSPSRRAIVWESLFFTINNIQRCSDKVHLRDFVVNWMHISIQSTWLCFQAPLMLFIFVLNQKMHKDIDQGEIWSYELVRIAWFNTKRSLFKDDFFLV